MSELVPHLEYTSRDRDEEKESRASLALAEIAVRKGYDAETLRYVMAHLGLVDGGPPGSTYTAEGRRRNRSKKKLEQ